jgi:dTDP-4-amino-4,6-dideoxygalactose transaminase
MSANNIHSRKEILMRIKFVDLVSQNVEIAERVQREMAEVHQNTAYVGGPQVEGFEKEFAKFLGARHAIGVASGTDALRLALAAIGVGPGDEVLTSPMTFIATAAAIRQTGALPVFIDVDPDTGNLSPERLREYLQGRVYRSGNRPRAIVPVHLYGLPVRMTEIGAIAAEFGLQIVEDACQAHGAQLHDGTRWRYAGTVGRAGCFSFYPGKNLGGWGEGGAVVTDDDEIDARIRSLRDHGRISHYAHHELGYNARLDSIQAVVLRAKLERLAQWNQRRREIAALYCELLGSSGLRLPVEPDDASSCYHLFAIRSPRRDALRLALLSKTIECGIHYPIPLHLQPACRDFGYRPGDLPVSEMIGDTELSLPIHPHLTNDEVKRVAHVLLEAINGNTISLAGEHGRAEIVSYLPRHGG